MFTDIIAFHHRHKIDHMDAAILEAIDGGEHLLSRLCVAVGRPPGKIQMMAARLKRHEKHGWIETTAHPASLRDRARKLTPAGKRLLKKIRSQAVQATCSGK